MALDKSPCWVVTMVSEPTSRPTAASTRSVLEVLTWDFGTLAFLAFLTAWAKSVPVSSHCLRVISVGLNLTRIGSKPNL